MSSEELEDQLHTLAGISPMPDDAALEDRPELVDLYAANVQNICRLLNGRFISWAVAALLHSFGIGDGFGTYWTTLHSIEKLTVDTAHSDEVYTLIRKALTDGPPGARKWGCLLLGRRRDPGDLAWLLPRLRDAEDEVVHQALHSVRMIACDHNISEAIPDVEAMLEHWNPSIVRAAAETLEALRAGPGGTTS
jgi:hypothetical protein